MFKAHESKYDYDPVVCYCMGTIATSYQWDFNFCSMKDFIWFVTASTVLLNRLKVRKHKDVRQLLTDGY